jgi:flagellar biosynthesis/type III secretory pathway chaperone
MITTDISSDTWQEIASSLRAELAEYGGLLALFEEQQKFLFERNAAEVMRLSSVIDVQARTLHVSRLQREKIVATFATAHQQPAGATLRSLLPWVDAVARPLLEALIDEINRLLHRVRRTSRHNHMLLARAIELHQETLQQLRPNSFTKTYSPAGRLSIASEHDASTLRAAG